MRSLLMIVVLAVASGCAGTRTVAEHALIRDGMDRASSTVRKEHKQWAEKALKGEPLPKLSQWDYDNRLDAHAQYEKIVNEDRARDKK